MISSSTTEAIEKFTSMVKRSALARAKDVRIDMVDATLLMGEIANVMARLAVAEHKTVVQNEATTVQVDAGIFRPHK